MKILDANGPEWVSLKGQINARIAELRERLEQDIDPEETAKIRGGLLELRSILQGESGEDTVAITTVDYLKH